jgi:hypothetical protein
MNVEKDMQSIVESFKIENLNCKKNLNSISNVLNKIVYNSINNMDFNNSKIDSVNSLNMSIKRRNNIEISKKNSLTCGKDF